MAIKKGDFVEVDFTGSVKGAEVFDTTLKSVAEKENLDTKNIKPFALAVGFEMLPKGFDSDLIGKEVGKDYSVDIMPENAFGTRNKELVKMVPTKLFLEQRIRPERGMQLSLDGQVVKIVSVSGGRTLVDFNGPLAGKEIVYQYKVNRMITDEKEKIDSIQDFFFRRRFDSEIKQDKVIFKVPKEFEQYINIFSDKFKEMLGKEIGIEIVELEQKK